MFPIIFSFSVFFITKSRRDTSTKQQKTRSVNNNRQRGSVHPFFFTTSYILAQYHIIKMVDKIEIGFITTFPDRSENSRMVYYLFSGRSKMWQEIISTKFMWNQLKQRKCGLWQFLPRFLLNLTYPTKPSKTWKMIFFFEKSRCTILNFTEVSNGNFKKLKETTFLILLQKTI